jgi:hypothetical protein
LQPFGTLLTKLNGSTFAFPGADPRKTALARRLPDAAASIEKIRFKNAMKIP